MHVCHGQNEPTEFGSPCCAQNDRLNAWLAQHASIWGRQRSRSQRLASELPMIAIVHAGRLTAAG